MSTSSCPGQKRFCRASSFSSDSAKGDSVSRDTSTPAPSSLQAGNVLPANVRSSASLQHSNVGQYYPIDESKIPEALQQWYTNRDARASKTVPIEGGGAVKPLPSFVAGCGGLQHELAQSQYPYLMYRCHLLNLLHFLRVMWLSCSQLKAQGFVCQRNSAVH